MDPLTILIAVAGIVATGALSKVGENVTDNVLSKSNELLTCIKNKSPHIAIVIENAEQQPIDYSQAYLGIEAIAKSDLRMKKLLQEMKEVVLTDQKVAETVEYELNKANSQLATVFEDWRGINIKGGINTITGNTFQF